MKTIITLLFAVISALALHAEAPQAARDPDVKELITAVTPGYIVQATVTDLQVQDGSFSLTLKPKNALFAALNKEGVKPGAYNLMDKDATLSVKGQLPNSGRIVAIPVTLKWQNQSITGNFLIQTKEEDKIVQGLSLKAKPGSDVTLIWVKPETK